MSSRILKGAGVALVSTALLAGCCHQPVSPEEATVQAKCTPVRTLIAKNYRLGFKASILGNGGAGGFEKSGTELTNAQADRQLDIDRICRAWVAHALTDAEWAAFLRKQGTASLAELSKATSLKDRADYEAALKELAIAIDGIGKKEDAGQPGDGIASLVSELKGRIETMSRTDPLELHKDLLNNFRELDRKVLDGRSALERTASDNSIRLVSLNEQLGVIKDGLAKLLSAPPPPKPERLVDATLAVLEFEKGSHELTNGALDQLRRKLQEYKATDVAINVSGYTDATGSTELNEKLAYRRAAAVRDWLIDELAVSSSRITVTGHVRPYEGEPRFAGKRVAVVRVLVSEALAATLMQPSGQTNATQVSAK